MKKYEKCIGRTSCNVIHQDPKPQVLVLSLNCIMELVHYIYTVYNLTILSAWHLCSFKLECSLCLKKSDESMSRYRHSTPPSLMNGPGKSCKAIHSPASALQILCTCRGDFSICCFIMNISECQRVKGQKYGKIGMFTGSHIFATLQCLTSSAKQYHVKACTCSTDVVSANLLAASSEAPTQD